MDRSLSVDSAPLSTRRMQGVSLSLSSGGELGERNNTEMLAKSPLGGKKKWKYTINP